MNPENQQNWELYISFAPNGYYQCKTQTTTEALQLASNFEKLPINIDYIRIESRTDTNQTQEE